jgi:DnaK suppressor protein
MDPQRAQELLARERARVEGALAEMARREGWGEVDDPGARDEVPRELVEAALEEGLATSLREDLEAIERAERRLSEGTYGVSVESGDPIPDGRLEAIPWAERTAAEEARFNG